MSSVLLAQRLAEAELAYHNLMLGTSARVVVDQNGERVEFTAANAERLKAYIESLKAEIARGGAAPDYRPLGALF